MENQYVIKATFNENIGGIAVDDKKKYSENLKLTKQDFNKGNSAYYYWSLLYQQRNKCNDATIKKLCIK